MSFCNFYLNPYINYFKTNAIKNFNYSQSDILSKLINKTDNKSTTESMLFKEIYQDIKLKIF